MKLFSPENAHWYQRDGQPRHTVPGRDGELRPTTVREARRLDLLPSVTNILAVIAKPELTDWKMEQAVLAALTLPRQPDEALDQFAARVVEDARGRGRAATDFGTAFHTGASLIAQSLTAQCSGPCAAWLDHFRAWLQANCLRVWWSERVLVSEEQGYAGQADLLMVHRDHGITLVDFKTQTFPAAGPRGGGASPRIYKSWAYQLAAYRRVLGTPIRCMNLIFDSAAPAPPVDHWWTEEELEDAWRVFEAAQLIWRYEKNYDPRRQPPTTLTAPGLNLSDQASTGAAADATHPMGPAAAD
jgi:hypothetical protein